MHRNSLPPELDPDPEQGQSPSQSLYTGLKQNILFCYLETLIYNKKTKCIVSVVKQVIEFCIILYSFVLIKVLLVLQSG